MSRSWAAERLSRLPPEARRVLLGVLTWPSNVRADVIRPFHERGEEEMVEVLVPSLRAREAPQVSRPGRNRKTRLETNFVQSCPRKAGGLARQTYRAES